MSERDETALADEPWIPEAIEIPIDGTLDLHHFSPKELQEIVSDYLEQCREAGILEVRIIHGKGVGALRRSVEAIIGRLPYVRESCGAQQLSLIRVTSSVRRKSKTVYRRKVGLGALARRLAVEPRNHLFIAGRDRSSDGCVRHGRPGTGAAGGPIPSYRETRHHQLWDSPFAQVR